MYFSVGASLKGIFNTSFVILNIALVLLFEVLRGGFCG